VKSGRAAGTSGPCRRCRRFRLGFELTNLMLLPAGHLRHQAEFLRFQYWVEAVGDASFAPSPRKVARRGGLRVAVTCRSSSSAKTRQPQRAAVD